MKRIATWLGSVALILAAMFVPVSPASATQTSTDCTSNDSTCMTVVWHNLSGSTGITVDYIVLQCDTEAWSWGWDHPADDGQYFKIWKGSPGLWKSTGISLDDAHSNLDFTGGSGSCVRRIEVNQTWPYTQNVLVEWDFVEQRNLSVDYEHYLSVQVSS